MDGMIADIIPAGSFRSKASQADILEVFRRLNHAASADDLQALDRILAGIPDHDACHELLIAAMRFLRPLSDQLENWRPAVESIRSRVQREHMDIAVMTGLPLAPAAD